MSPTLFRYIFKDLLRIFFLTSGALAGIMSFGGMLKPLYEVGLDVSQVGQILTWSSPAMMAYALPISALFATTIVYGRLGADNEITACRAAGISYLWMTFPAFVLGVVTAFISVAMLCFVVPRSMLNVERIVYSNLAQIVAGQIEMKHQIRLDQSGKPVQIFARSASVLPPDPNQPYQQAVTLEGPVITLYEPYNQRTRSLVPREFFMASQATAYIIQDPANDDDLSMYLTLSDGTNFPRSPAVANQKKPLARVSVGSQAFGPIKQNSPVKESTKFMDIFRLQMLHKHPENSRRIQAILRDFVRDDQQRQYLQSLADDLNKNDKTVSFITGDYVYTLVGGGEPARVDDDRLMVTASPDQPIRVVQKRDGRIVLNLQAQQARITANPTNGNQRIELAMFLYDCLVDPGNGTLIPRENFSRYLSLPMPAAVAAMATNSAEGYLKSVASVAKLNDLNRNLKKLQNSVISELHARMSFAVSCLVLVMVGCALGMMFRSGNFLSAFAVSVVPALLCIALVVTGQHTCENVPNVIPDTWTNPLRLGIAIIWSGNAAVLVIAAVLLGRLQKQ